MKGGGVGRVERPMTGEPDTLLEVIVRRAREDPELEAFTFAGRPCPWGELGEAIRRCARLLQERGVGSGDRVLLALPNGPGFFAAFYGAQAVGGVPVPILPTSGAERVRDFARRADVAAVLLPPAAAEEAAAAIAPAGEGREVLSVADAAACSPTSELRPGGSDDLALLQFTSGTTGDPKGVELTHRHLVTNVRQMIEGMRISRREVFVSWLPVFHDMGLVLMTMVPFFLAARLVLLPAGMGGIRGWVEALARHRATLTAAPDFAYRLALRLVREPGEHDLSSLRLALDAAEPVRSGTLAAFERTFDLSTVMVSGYGLAEATVGVTTSPPGRPVKVDERGLVSVGSGFPGVELEVVRDDGTPAAAGEVGEILVGSPAAARGYFRDPGATRQLFARPGVVRTGDLGYLDGDGDLFVAGRRKQMILQAGQNIAPQEVEETVDDLLFVRRSAAVGIDRGGLAGEQAFVFAEVGRRRGRSLPELAAEVVQAFHRRLGFRPGRVVLLASGGIPTTPNGKKRYDELTAAYRDGSLRAAGTILFPEY